MEKKTVLKQGLKERIEDALKGGRVLMFSAPCGFGKRQQSDHCCPEGIRI